MIHWMSYVEKLWISDGTPVTLNWENCHFIVLDTLVQIVWDTVEYIVDNIAQLLLLNPNFEDANIQAKIEAIRTRDSAIEVLEHELIGEWKTYVIIDWSVWWDGNGLTKQGEKLRASAECITNDITHFKPINALFSRDESNVYYQYYKIWDYNTQICPNPDTFHPIWNSSYWHDWVNLFCWFNFVKWADVSNWVELISEKHSYVRDSSNQIFWWHTKVNVVSPDNFAHSYDDFFFDGEHVYMDRQDITKWHRLPKWENIVSIGGNIYKIWEVEFEYDGLKLMRLN